MLCLRAWFVGSALISLNCCLVRCVQIAVFAACVCLRRLSADCYACLQIAVFAACLCCLCLWRALCAAQLWLRLWCAFVVVCICCCWSFALTMSFCMCGMPLLLLLY